MYNILTLNKISQAGLGKLPHDKFNVGDDIANPDGIILRSYSMHEMELPESLLAIARAGAGTNNIPVNKCAEEGIVVFNSPGANANAVKELVLCALLFSSRNVIGGIEWTKSLKGQSDADKQVEKGKSQFIGPEIMGKTLGIIGLGNTGGRIAIAAAALGMQILGYDPYMREADAYGKFTQNFTYTSDLEQIMKESDYITVHVPLTADNKYMFNTQSFGLMKKGVRLLNFSRGELVNNNDLKQAVADGTIAYYITDFPSAEVLEIDNVIALPHIGASTPESEENCAAMAALEIKDYLESGNIQNSVNYANCHLPVTPGKTRIGIHHKNVPAMIHAITSVVSAENLNISNIVSSSKGDFAYCLLETDDLGDKYEKLLADLKAIEGVIRVRIIMPQA